MAEITIYIPPIEEDDFSNVDFTNVKKIIEDESAECFEFDYKTKVVPVETVQEIIEFLRIKYEH